MAALPKSPAGPRRTSSGSSLRPIIPLNLDDPDGGSAVELEEPDEAALGPITKSPGTYASGQGVDEVEYAFG
jgi:hypothetical protein